MALSGHLSDLSLSELIEFFCNQRKTGCLKVLYPQGPGCFYLQTGSVVDARIGVLRGIDAVYYALTLPNAQFEFSGSANMSDRSINQPWTQVVLEGLRRLDEGIEPPEAFPTNYKAGDDDIDLDSDPVPPQENPFQEHAFLSFLQTNTISQRKPLVLGAVGVAILASVAVIGVPAGWYKRTQVTAAAQAVNTTVSETANPTSNEQPVASETVPADNHANDEASLAAKRQRDRAKVREEKNAATEQALRTPAASIGTVADNSKSGPKKVTVTVSYDESGRVTQASGSDATAIRIARQKRFPAGKAGSTTVTIPIN